MLEMLAVIGPMFLVLGVGFTAGFVPRFRSAQDHLNGFLFYFALPTFIYTAMVTAPPTAGFPVLAVAIVAVVTPLVSIALYYGSFLFGDRGREGAAATSLAGSFGNVGYFGIPVSISVIGPEAGLAAGIVHMMHNLIYLNGYPLVRTIVAARAEPSAASGANAADARKTGRAAGVGQLLRTQIWPILKRALLLNPVFIAMGLALLVVFSPLGLPAPINESVSLLGQTAVPLALFCVGLALHPAIEGIRSGGVPKRLITLGTLGKILVLPLLTWLAVLPFYDQLGPVWAGTLIIIAAMPSSTTVYIFAQQYEGDGRLAASILVTSTLACLITLPLLAELLL
ncbi:AEC family transporter [Nesterenkonia sp. E16_7]|uniref:AEC family transporter n=1 Tax=unclassified Nesterenkonia TaxID=2629769 RepID=UPI001A90D58F|nr:MULTISPECIES: AEC family transporter [unclassified Nesterenkonia]MBO0595890.1 AEC family transporter [Nesterenkonia sp. E16_10]MBO0599511.1 AEC family transporter [Nesterenkonia sp. E16_7]